MYPEPSRKRLSLKKNYFTSDNHKLFKNTIKEQHIPKKTFSSILYPECLFYGSFLGEGRQEATEKKEKEVPKISMNAVNHICQVTCYGDIRIKMKFVPFQKLI